MTTTKKGGRIRKRQKWTPWVQLQEPANPDRLVDEPDQVRVANNIYLVIMARKTFVNPGGEEGAFTYLSIKRHDKKPIHDWRELLRIKNELIGAECWAVEIYPPMKHLMDTSNQFHLYAFPEGYVMPFGVYANAVVVDGDGTTGPGKSCQRPLPDWYPAAMTQEEADRLIGRIRDGPSCPHCRGCEVCEEQGGFVCTDCGAEWVSRKNGRGP